MYTGHTVEVGTPDKADMHTQISMVRGAVQTQVDTERHTRPCWVLRAAVEADLVGLLPLQSLEDGV